MMRCLTSGAAGYLLKPVNCAVLAEKLQNLQSAKTTFTTTGKPSNLGKTLDEKDFKHFHNRRHTRAYQGLSVSARRHQAGCRKLAENQQHNKMSLSRDCQTLRHHVKQGGKGQSGTQSRSPGTEAK